jgi:SOS-response transcriptional repressor LexA
MFLALASHCVRLLRNSSPDKTSDLTHFETSVHMNIMSITDRLQAVMDFFRDLRADRGVMPSLREIQGDFKFASSHAAHRHVQTLEKKGAIQRSGGATRSVTATGMVHVNLVHIPLLGMVPAGYPSDQEQQSDRCVSIDEDTLQLPKNAEPSRLRYAATR